MKRFFTSLFAFFALMALLQFAFYEVKGKQRYYAQRVALTRLDGHVEQGAQTVYFGDSTVFSVAPTDSDKRSESQMVRDFLKGQTLGEVALPAYSLTQFELFMKYLGGKAKRPRNVIMPVNIRSFSPSWDLRPDWQFQVEKLFVDYDWLPCRVFFGPLVVFKAMDFNLNPVEMPEYLEAPVFNGDQPAGTVRDYYIDFGAPPEHPDLSKQFVFCYMHRIRPEHRKAQSLRHVVQLAKASGVQLYLYVPPLDYLGGVGYLGDEFSARVEENVAALKKIVEAEGGQLHDFSRLLTSEHFCPPPFMPNDHLNESGRKILAEQVADGVLVAGGGV